MYTDAWRATGASDVEPRVSAEHTSAYVSLRQLTSAYVSLRQHTSA